MGLPTAFRCRAPRPGPSYAWTFLLAIVGGCGDDGVQHYVVPKAPPAPAAQRREPGRGPGVPVRLLGAIVSHGPQAWFFKVIGPPERLEEEKAVFARFLSSVRFHDAGDPPVTWTLPDGWRQKPASGIRFATLALGPKDPPLDLTVTPLTADGGAGSILANVNRWRAQLGLPAVDEAGLAASTTTIDAGGEKATVVDIEGIFSAPSAMTPPFAGAAGEKPAGHPPIESPPAAAPDGAKPPAFATPPGWTELPAGGMVVAALAVVEGDRQAKVTVVPLDGAAGGFAANVNRWRGQVGLEPATEDGIRASARTLPVAGDAAAYLDIAGPETAAGGRQRILGVVAVRGGQTWFFKMQGPFDLVGRHQAEFEGFVGSVRF